MTGAENFKKQWKEVVKELVLAFKKIQGKISKHEKGIVQAAKDAEKAWKRQERAVKKAAEAAEKARKKVEREQAAAVRAAHGRGCAGRGLCGVLVEAGARARAKEEV